MTTEREVTEACRFSDRGLHLALTSPPTRADGSPSSRGAYILPPTRKKSVWCRISCLCSAMPAPPSPCVIIAEDIEKEAPCHHWWLDPPARCAQCCCRQGPRASVIGRKAWLEDHRRSSPDGQLIPEDSRSQSGGHQAEIARHCPPASPSTKTPHHRGPMETKVAVPKAGSIRSQSRCDEDDSTVTTKRSSRNAWPSSPVVVAVVKGWRWPPKPR